jgi:excinuclease ABC subunit C
VTCRKRWTNNERQKPCLYHHMGRCPEAPCAGLADKSRYAEAVKDVELFLSGRQDNLLKAMERRWRRRPKT